MEKFKYIQNRNVKGFTLVELLVVIAIVGFLSLLAVGSYLEYRRISLINLAADNFVSQINQVRTKAVYGVFDKDENSAPECFGIRFVKKGDGKWDVNKFTSPYNSQKEWNADVNDWVVKGCECKGEIVSSVVTGVAIVGTANPVSVATVSECNYSGPFEKDESVNVFGSWYEKSGVLEKNDNDNFVILFMPPKGQAVIFSGNSTLSQTTKLATVLRYGANNSSKYQSGFVVDLMSGQASKLSYEALDKITSSAVGIVGANN